MVVINQDLPIGAKDEMSAVVSEYLRPGEFIDSDHPAIKAFTDKALQGVGSAAVERAIALYYAVRDGLRYDPYSMKMDEDNFVASNITYHKAGFCIPKAILLTACSRAVGIPARIGYADVRNHLCSPKLKAAMAGNDLFMYHGYVEMYLQGKWVKCTPAFNRELCDKVGIQPLDFNGLDDSMLHPFDKAGQKHMEYVKDHGHFFDHPHRQIREAFQLAYGDLEFMLGELHGDFATEANTG